MKQNKYDDDTFFTKYSQMPRSVNGLNAAGEWQTLRTMLPELRDRTVLDLGCGFGWHCRYAREQHARSVIGIDLSEKMLARAEAMTDDSAITYMQCAIEDFSFAEGQFDVVISSLAIHYIERFDLLCRKVYDVLSGGGTFVLSVEHPVFTASAAQDWHYSSDGERLHWPVDHYYEEGIRQTNFLESNVIKYHRTVATYMNALLAAGFSITHVAEPQPTQQMLEEYPDMRDELRRPIFLMISASKR